MTDDEDTEFYTHDDWEHGHPCPECSNEEMNVVQVSGETYRHFDGTIEHIDYSPFREDLKIECDECGTLLLRHPAMDRVNAI